MQSCKIEAHVREDHRLVVTLPADFPTGEVEILVQTKESIRRDRAETESGAALEALLAWQRNLPRQTASVAEVEARIQAERNAWDD